MIIHFTIHPTTLWLAYITGGLLLLGPILGLATARWLELGSLVLTEACWALAFLTFVLMVGSIL